MLLAVNPGSVHETTNAGETLLSLAQSTATKSHPNYALIDELHRQLNGGRPSAPSNASPNAAAATTRTTTTTAIAPAPAVPAEVARTPSRSQYHHYHPDSTTAFHHYHHYHHHNPGHHNDYDEGYHHGVAVSSDPSDTSSVRGRLDSNDSNRSWPNHPQQQLSPAPVAASTPSSSWGGPGGVMFTPPPVQRSGDPAASVPAAPARKRRKSVTEAAWESHHRHRRQDPAAAAFPDDPAGLLLHFSRNGSPRSDGRDGIVGGGVMSPSDTVKIKLEEDGGPRPFPANFAEV